MDAYEIMYEYINHVLSNYLNANVGLSEDEAISMLRNDLKNSIELSKGLRSDLEKAFSDRDFLWKDAFAENDIFFTDSEEEASSYAKKMLWTSLFEA